MTLLGMNAQTKPTKNIIYIPLKLILPIYT